MPVFVVLGNWTDQGFKNVKEAPNRIKETHKAVQEAGGSMELYYTLGEYDFVMIFKLPNDNALVKVLVWLGSKGNVRTKTLKAWTEEEAEILITENPS
jgi:uncharacterized protein with GYD domain